MQLFIDGGWRPGASERRLAVLDKSNGALIDTVPVADARDVEAAVAGAQRAFLAWRARPLEDRVAVLRRCAQAMREAADDLGGLIVRELGRPVAAARSEIVRSAELLDGFAEEALQLHGQWQAGGTPGSQVLVTYEPVGVVAAIAPFNYPVTLLCFKLGAALAAGCTVVAKPAEDTPLATLALAEILYRAGLPAGAFQVITGTGAEAGMALVEHPLVRKIAFTGGTQAGKAIARAAAAGVKRLTLELGGHCPAIVCADADLARAVPAIVRHAYANSGQLCYRVNRIYVHRAVYEDFVARLGAATARLHVGAPTEPGVDMGPLVNERLFANTARQVQDALEHGARLVCGGQRVHVPGCEAGWFHAPTVIADATPQMLVMREETFGPLLGVQCVESDAQALALANGTESGLAAFVFTRDLARGLELCRALETGSVWLNDIARSSQRAPFGGVKQSGLGREKSRWGLDSYLEAKTVYLSYDPPALD
jgi:succinate-semialdehyde dehydrogenase / glutarate-semialdehyde dehydrogenase